MKLNHLMLIADAVEKIHQITETNISDIVDALTGVAWDEEVAGQIEAYFTDADRRGGSDEGNDEKIKPKKDN